MNRKTIRKYNKKHKTIRRAIRRTRKGGDVKDFRDKMFTKFGRQSQAKTEFKSLLRRMEKLQVFGVTGCNHLFSSQFSNLKDSEYMVDILREKFNSIPNRDDIIDALIQLGLLYLKYPREWNFTSDLSDNADDAKNIKYKCVVNIGKSIGEKIKAEKELVEKKLLYIKEETEILLKTTTQQTDEIISKLSSSELKDTVLDNENLRLKNLLANLTGKIACINEIIKEINKSYFIDITALSESYRCVNDTFARQLPVLLRETNLPTRLEQQEHSAGGSRRRRMNTHRRGKHTRRYKPKK